MQCKFWNRKLFYLKPQIKADFFFVVKKLCLFSFTSAEFFGKLNVIVTYFFFSYSSFQPLKSTAKIAHLVIEKNPLEYTI